MIVRSTFQRREGASSLSVRVPKPARLAASVSATAPIANYPTHPLLRPIPSLPYSRILGFETESSGHLHLGYKIFLYSTGYQP